MHAYTYMHIYIHAYIHAYDDAYFKEVRYINMYYFIHRWDIATRNYITFNTSMRFVIVRSSLRHVLQWILQNCVYYFLNTCALHIISSGWTLSKLYISACLTLFIRPFNMPELCFTPMKRVILILISIIIIDITIHPYFKLFMLH